MKRLFRSRSDRKIGGLCGGFAEMVNIDPTLIRLAVVVLGIATGVAPFFIGYLIAWWIIPEADASHNGV
jgi:phage shock protein PspC (stress-responsive transcriptional regulator)